MEICPAEPPAQSRPLSIIEAKNKIRLGHDECCRCCCCCTPQPKCYKYVQPEVPKSFAPVRIIPVLSKLSHARLFLDVEIAFYQYYWKPNVPLDDNTTYRLSYWESTGPANVQPLRPEDCLTVGDGPISDETTHKMSYLGNWCVKPDRPMYPCDKNLLGRGPMQDVTTQKHDYMWKCTKPSKPFKQRDNIYPACATMSDNTTYRLSYYDSGCRLPIPSYKPRRKYEKSDVPMDGCTTYRLSYWPNEPPVKENYPWMDKGEYRPPVQPLDVCTTYRLSYWPHSQKPRAPFTLQETDNLLNANCCFDDNTTYRLSYFGCGGDRPDPIRQPGSRIFSPCPLSHDTIHRLSFLGNWCVKPEKPLTPCDKSLLGRGPMQDVTTQKHDYTWKQGMPSKDFRPENNLAFSPIPLECCTTHRLSYIPNNLKSLLPAESYAPKRRFKPSDVPMDSETTMRLSYQPVEPADRVDKPWSSVVQYQPPVTAMEDNTTYNLSYIPPGTLVPLPPCCVSCPPSNSCDLSPCQPCPAKA